MTKQANGPTDLANGHHKGALRLSDAKPSASPRAAGMQLLAFRDLALRIHTDLSVPRFEAALRALLMPMKKSRRQPTVQPPTHSPES